MNLAYTARVTRIDIESFMLYRVPPATWVSLPGEARIFLSFLMHPVRLWDPCVFIIQGY